MNPISKTYPRKTHTGFTLIELLVVIVIIGMLLGMLMPAVQYARESARRALCMNRLHQFGIAMNGYASVQGGYPAVRPKRAMHGWTIELLPHLDADVFVADWNSEKDYFASENSRLLQRYLSIFHCPSTPDARRIVSVSKDYYGNGIAEITGMASDYYAHCEGMTMSDGKRYANVLQDTKITHPNSVTDGVSHCIVLNEQCGRNVLYQGGVKVSGSVVSKPYTSLWAAAVSELPNMVSPSWGHRNIVNITNDSFYSFHPRSTDVLLLDGNVRRISENVVPYVLLAMNTRDAGENVMVDDLEMTELDDSFVVPANEKNNVNSTRFGFRLSRFGSRK